MYKQDASGRLNSSRFKTQNSLSLALRCECGNWWVQGNPHRSASSLSAGRHSAADLHVHLVTHSSNKPAEAANVMAAVLNHFGLRIIRGFAEADVSLRG